jgi:hypothetical protein
VKITINIPPVNEDDVLDAFADSEGRSEAIVERRVAELVAQVVAEHASAVASAPARSSVRDVVQAKRDEVAAGFGVTLPDPRRGPPGAPGRPR